MPMTEEPTFTPVEIRCNTCGEHIHIHGEADELEQQTKHVQRHQLGKCTKCGHWNDAHAQTTESVREYLGTNQQLVCNTPLGMGDFCGCDGNQN